MSWHFHPSQAHAPRAIVFLDIDGVLAPFDGGVDLDLICVARLRSLVERAAAEVVICSSWRETMSRHEIRRALQRHGFDGPVIGATPILPRGTRADEIGTYLAGLANMPAFVILDDVAAYPAELAEYVVLVDDAFGLRDPDVLRALEILGR